MLQKVTIMTGDFEKTIEQIGVTNFFYFDPPYRPLSETSSFTSYSKDDFNDDAQIRLMQFCNNLNNLNISFMLSNSDGFGTNGKDRFLDDLYEDFQIERVIASRNINSIASKRGKLSEILVRNYQEIAVI